MIVVKVEIWPGGDKLRRKTLKELRVANMSNLAEVSNYKYVLTDPANDLLPEKVGYVEGHRRSDGVVKLLGKVFQAVLG